jgi:hypothetical protein
MKTKTQELLDLTNDASNDISNTIIPERKHHKRSNTVCFTQEGLHNLVDAYTSNLVKQYRENQEEENNFYGRDISKSKTVA